MVRDFCTEEPDLYRPMFAYQPRSNDMNVALSRYSFDWLSKHPDFYKYTLEREGHASEADAPSDGFVLAYRRLCESFIRNDAVDDEYKSPIIEQLVQSSVQYLDELLKISEKADERMRRLVYEGEKSRHLFRRLFEQLKENPDESV